MGLLAASTTCCSIRLEIAEDCRRLFVYLRRPDLQVAIAINVIIFIKRLLQLL